MPSYQEQIRFQQLLSSSQPLALDGSDHEQQALAVSLLDQLQGPLSSAGNQATIQSLTPKVLASSAALPLSLDLGPKTSAQTTTKARQDQFPPLIGGNYHFETPSLDQLQNIIPATATTKDMSTGSVSPGLQVYADNYSQWSQDRRGHDGFHSNGVSHYDGFYPERNAHYGSGLPIKDGYSSTSTLSPQAPGSSHSFHAQSFGAMPPVLQQQHLLHRASISGPVMGASSYPSEVEAMAAPPRAHGLAAWENASGGARPHTADGMFGQVGYPAGITGEAAGAEGSIRPYTPGMPMDPYSQQRRFSMPGPSTEGPVFSYMPPADDGMYGYGHHMVGGMGGFGSTHGKKRPRRRYDEIERLYPCKWPGCNKSYGTLNHLNAHVAMQKHGPKRSPSEFKDMRKAWRKQKKEEDQRRQQRQASLTEQAIARGELARPVMGQNAYRHGSLPLHAGMIPSGGGLPTAGPSVSLLAQLSRYSMYSVSTGNGPADSFGYPVQQHEDGRSGPHFSQGGLGAYLMAHRGSI